MTNTEYEQNAMEYDISQMTEYTEHLLSNLSNVSKTIFELMNGYKGAWDSRPVCMELERLVKIGKAELLYQSSSLFQDKNFIKKQREVEF